MDIYKKRSLKFSHEQFSRDFRHAETLKARDSSRFKRLSMIRSINDSDFIDEHNTGNEAMGDMSDALPKSAEVPVPEQTESDNLPLQNTKNLSRLEMLHKWRQEKMMKQELERKIKKKPFYVGSSSNKPSLKNFSCDKTNQNLKSSFINQSTMSFISTGIARNKIVAPSFQPPKSSKQSGPPAPFQPSRVPNNSKLPSLGIKSTTNTLSKGMYGKKPTPTSENCGTVTTNKTGSASKMANVGSKLMSSKITPSSSKVTPSSRPNFNKKEISATKPEIQKLPVSKLMFSRLPNKSIQKVGSAATKLASGIPSTFSKGVPAPKPQTQVPGPSIRKLGAVNMPIKPTSKESLKTDKKGGVTERKGYCFKKPAAIAKPQQADSKKATVKKPEEKVEDKFSKEVLHSEQSHKNASEVTFNCDISIIPTPSFAPVDFKFQAPDDLWCNLLEDDNEIHDIMEQARKFMSRTSTPSREISGRASSLCLKDPELSSLPDMQNTSENTSDKSASNSAKVVDEIPKLLLNGETIDTKSHLNDKLPEDLQDNGPVNISTSETCLDNKGLQKVPSYTETCGANDKIPDNVLTESHKVESLESEIPDLFVIESFKIPKKFRNSTKLLSSKVDEIAPDQSLKIESEDAEMFSESSDEKPADGIALNKSLIGKIGAEKVSDLQNEACNENGASESADDSMHVEKTVEHDWFPLSTSELNEIKKIAQAHIESLKLEDEELDFGDVTEEQVFVDSEKKSCGAIHKRVSMLKQVSVLNSIAETSEADEPHIKSPKESKDILFTPRRSMRLSSSVCQMSETVNKELSNIEESPLIAITPRRSMRLNKGVPKSFEVESGDVLSPFKTRRSVCRTITPRRSLRLINLNSDTPSTANEDLLITPVKGEEKKSNLTANFARLQLKSEIENVVPTDLIDFECSPEPMPRLRSKKVSLLYSPEKRRHSIRKSIKGDLMSFSPGGN